MSRDLPNPGAARATAPLPPPLAAVLLVAAVYVFFLIFAQFGFLRGVRDAGLDTTAVQSILGLMALTGAAASLLAPRAIRARGSRAILALGLAICSAAAALASAAFAHRAPLAATLAVISALTGAGLGLATVALAVSLRPLTGPRRVGLGVGLGTGLAYLVCNVPALFNASPAAQSFTAALFASAGAVVALQLPRVPEALRNDDAALHSALTGWRALGLATSAFFALVWFDSAAFAAIQLDPALATAFSAYARAHWTIGGIHAAAAIAAGWLLDRGFFRSLLACAFTLLALGAAALVSSGSASTLGAPLYVAGVSVYSTALAACAALTPTDGRGPSPAWRAACIYALAGWFGSVLGIGLAEDRHALPAWAMPVAAIFLAAALLRLRPRNPLPSPALS